MQRPEALLLLGPTGSGKTPLGVFLAIHGLCGRPCTHFDFGENLRRVVAEQRPGNEWSQQDLAFLHRVLQTGALLEDRDFPIAARILQSHLARSRCTPAMLTILNGLPRHAGQASALDTLVEVRTVAVLHCSPAIARARIVRNTGGDRTHRTDDDPAAIRRKVALFTARTAPLVDHYRRPAVTLVEIPVGVDTTAAEMAEAVQIQLSAAKEHGTGTGNCS